MSKSYIKSSGHYGVATDDSIMTNGHLSKPYYGQDDALTASGHGGKELGPEEAFYSWIIDGGTIDAQGSPVLLIREEGSGYDNDRTRTRFNLAAWTASAKKIKSVDKTTGEIKTYSLQAVEKRDSYF